MFLATDGLNVTPAEVFALLRGKLDDESLVDLATYITSHAAQHGLFDDLAVVVVEH